MRHAAAAGACSAAAVVVVVSHQWEAAAAAGSWSSSGAARATTAPWWPLPQACRWTEDERAERCCDRAEHRTGDAACWNAAEGRPSYSECCTLLSAPPPPLPHPPPAGATGPPARPPPSPVPGTRGPTWCGTICADPPPDQDRPWEVLRYHLAAVLGADPADIGVEDEGLLLAEAGHAMKDIFKWVAPEDLAVSCPVGSLVLSLLRAASSVGGQEPGSTPDATAGPLADGERGAAAPATAAQILREGSSPSAALPAAAVVPSTGPAQAAADATAAAGGTSSFALLGTAATLLGSREGLRAAFCGGWPIFRLLSLAAANVSAPSPGMSMEAILRLRRQQFDIHLEPGDASDGLAVDPGMVLHAAVESCLAEAPFRDCLVAARPVLNVVHVAQSRNLFGLGVCPPGAHAAWLDRMAPAPAFPLCVRTWGNQVDGEIKMRGAWKTCQQLAELLADPNIGRPGCRVLDIGANVGACTVMLARLGYRVTAFEPLAANTALLEASLRLNGIPSSPSRPGAAATGPGRARRAAEGPAEGGRGEGLGTVDLHKKAVGQKASESLVLEGRDNAGMSIVLDGRPGSPDWDCDEDRLPGGIIAARFLCHRAARVRVARLDDAVGGGAEDDPFCLAKIDVEGSELKVLRGAVSLLRSRAIGTLHLEWWPPHLTAMGEEPIALLWFLHAMRYEIFAPASWFSAPEGSKAAADTQWAMVVPDQFPWLLQRWGDIVARAVPW